MSHMARGWDLRDIVRWAWRLMHAILTLMGLKQEGCYEFKVNLDYIASSMLA